jgi:Uma2 family endonuclease
MTTTRLYTAEDLEALGSDAPYVLIDGRLVYEEMGSGGRSSELGGLIVSYLNAFARPHRLGKVYGADGTFILRRNPDTAVMPDAAFLLEAHVPPPEQAMRFLPVAPDIAVEVLSPTDRAGATARKVALYLASGVPLVWQVNPAARTITVYAPDREPRTLTENDTLDGGEVLPGFALPLAELFAP